MAHRINVRAHLPRAGAGDAAAEDAGNGGGRFEAAAEGADFVSAFAGAGKTIKP